MGAPPRRFAVPDGTSAEDVVAALGRALPTVVERPVTRRRTFYDTFDWRVHGAGGVLEVEDDGDGGRLVLRSPAGEERAAAPAPAELRLARDLPDGPVHDAVAGLLDVRALLPVAKVRTTTTVVRVLDDDRKTVARVAVDRDVVGRATLGHRVRLLPVRGYERAMERVARVVTTDLGLREADGDVLEAALAAAGRRPGDYSSKVRVPLEPSTPAVTGATVLLSALLRVVEANEPGARDDVDPEFLHDLRVAVRRTRTAVRAFRGVLPDEVVTRAGDEFRWAQQVTGPVRDLDVHLMDLAAASEGLAPDVAADLAPLATHLAGRRAAEQRALAKVLRSRQWRELLDWWRTVLADPGAAGPIGPEAGVPVVALATDRVRRADRRVRKRGRAIDDGTPAEALHDLRKRCKELRYLLELFGPALPGDAGPVVADLKALQENLGTFQDCQVQEAELRSLGDDLVAAGAGAGTVMAMGIMVEDLRRRAGRARAEFAGVFAEFDRPAARRRVDRLLRLP
jgi:CHAD domain-containing protein